MFVYFFYLERDRRPAENRSVFHAVFHHCASKLGLTTHILEALVWSRHKHKPGSFLALLAWVASILPEGIDWLLEASTDAARNMHLIHEASSNRTSVTKALLEPILSTLATHNVEPTPVIRGFFQAVLLSPLFRPVLPRELPGWAHRPRGCNRCNVCGELDEFIALETQIVWFTAPGQWNVDHLESQLSSQKLRVVVCPPPYRGSAYRITVMKLKRETDNDVLEFNEKVAVVRSDLSPLRGGYLQKLFSEDRYRELVLLDSEGDGTSQDEAKRPAYDRAAGEGESKRLKT